jgi:aspartate/methionine/tyrosine aminotransferase
MKIEPFALERYFAKHEFSAPYLLSCSDAEPLSLNELLDMADEETRGLWEKLSLGYTESQGHPLLLKELASLYESITPQNVVEVIPEEGIFIAMNVLLEAGNHMITTYPGYQSLSEIALSIGCRVSKWQPDFSQGMRFAVEDLYSLVQEDTKLIVINFPHNPTGALISRNELDAVIQLASAKGIIVFSDEMYRYTEVDAANRLPSVCEIYKHGISLFGLSKSFSLPGLRVGWLASQDCSLVKAVNSYKDYTTICASAPSEILAIIALRAKEKILSRVGEITSRNLKILDAFFREFESVFRWIRPLGGTIGFPELLLEKSVDDFCEELLAEKGVLLLPASVIGHDSNHFRIGFGRANMPDALKRLAEFIDNKKFA